jgi:hypothetical protein
MGGGGAHRRGTPIEATGVVVILNKLRQDRLLYSTDLPFHNL